MLPKLKNIPVHDFSLDNASSIPFKITPLELKHEYDSNIPHRHNYYEVFIFKKGGGIHEIDFSTFEIVSNSIHFVSPGQVHQVQRSLNTYGQLILFSRDFYGLNINNKDLLFDLPFLNNNSSNPILNLSEIEMSVFLPLLETIDTEFKSDNQQREEIIRSYLHILLMRSHQLYANKYPEASTVQGSKMYKDFRILLEKNFIRLHKVKEYAELMSTTQKTLNETIKKLTGKTASDHIYDRIILEAKRLLKHSALNTKEIAYFLNYQDPAHFSKFFKTKTGLSPSDYIN